MSQGKETSLELRNMIVRMKCEKKSYAEIAKIVKKKVGQLFKQSTEIMLCVEMCLTNIDVVVQGSLMIVMQEP
jgi:hypothetical protein